MGTHADTHIQLCILLTIPRKTCRKWVIMFVFGEGRGDGVLGERGVGEIFTVNLLQ